jgi:hypothetical protein
MKRLDTRKGFGYNFYFEIVQLHPKSCRRPKLLRGGSIPVCNVDLERPKLLRGGLVPVGNIDVE